MRFGTSGKLAPRFIGPYEIIEKVGTRAYRVYLPSELAGVRNVFHVSYLRKCLHKTATLGELVQLLRIDMEPIAPRTPACIVEHRTRKLLIKKLGWSKYNGERIQQKATAKPKKKNEIFSPRAFLW